MSQQNAKCPPVLKIHCEDISKTFIQKGNQEVPVIKDITLEQMEAFQDDPLIVSSRGSAPSTGWQK